MMNKKALLFENLCKSYGRKRVVDNVSFSINEGEYLCLLGASGSGKTTLLRLIAGLETPESGRIVFFGKDVTRNAPHERGIPLVFQHLSLWPHMNVLQQIMFGLVESGVDRQAARELASYAINTVDLAGLENRRPGELSGGQQQRVALARALVLGGKVILLDEPLANLDAHLKNEMRVFLRRLTADLGVTVLHVTHDRDDAFELADRVAIMDEGRIIACDTPISLYRRPPAAFIASLLGECNLLSGNVASFDHDGVVMDTDLGVWRANHYTEELAQGSRANFLFRPESVEIASPENMGQGHDNRFSAETVSSRFSGLYTAMELAVATDHGGYIRITRYASHKHELNIPRMPDHEYSVPASEIIAMGNYESEHQNKEEQP